MAPPVPRGRHDFEIAIVCALPLEADAAIAVFDKNWEDEGEIYGKAPGDCNTYTTGTIGDDNVVIVHLPGMGKATAATAASHLKISFRSIKLVIVLGICGGVPNDRGGREIVLGDVVVSQSICQYDFGRRYPAGFVPRDNYSQSNPEIQGLIAKAKTSSSRQNIQNDVLLHLQLVQRAHPEFKYIGVDEDKLYESTYTHKHQQSLGQEGCSNCMSDNRLCEEAQLRSCKELGCAQSGLIVRQRLREAATPSVHFGTIGSADTVMKSAVDRDELAKHYGIIAFEMEGAGVWAGFPSLIIKGVCDYADSHKNKKWQDYAAATAACCTKAILKFRTPEDHSAGLRLQDPVTTSDVYWHIPFTQPPAFVGREKQAKQLRDKLFQPNSTTRVALCGLGGMGKSRLALQMAIVAKELKEPRSIFWIQATTQATFEKDILEIGTKLQIRGFENPSIDRKRLLKQHLSTENAGQWLLILDNADDEAMWCPPSKQKGDTVSLLDYIPSSHTGSVIVTTRSQRVAVWSASSEVITLEQMEQGDAIEMLTGLLINKSQIASNHGVALELVKQLSCLPLAIVQAAAYINISCLSTHDYLRLLNKNKEEEVLEILSEDFEDKMKMGNTQRSVASTWLLSFEQIQRLHGKAIDYLCYMSCLSEKNIPHSLLPDDDTDKELMESIGILIGYSFIQRQDQDDLSATLYSMHRLVRLSTRNWLRNESKLRHWNEIAISRMVTMFPYDFNEKPELKRKYVAHAQVLCTADCDSDFEEKYELLHRVGEYFSEERKTTEAIDYLSTAASWRRKQFSVSNISTLVVCTDLGTAYRRALRLNEAEKCFSEIYEESQTSLGTEHRLTLSIAACLATLYRRQGLPEKAEAIQVKIVEVDRRLQQISYDDMMLDLSYLAMIYLDLGRYADAQSLLTEAWCICKRTMDSGDPSALILQDRLAALYNAQGDYSMAEELKVKALEIEKNVLGPDHPNTLASMINLARTYKKQGQLQKAEELLLQVLETSKRVLGVDHPDTLEIIDKLALTYEDQGRYREAEELFAQLVESSKRVLGIDHLDTLSRMGGLAKIYWLQNRHEEAERLDVEVLVAMRKVLVADHDDTLLQMSTVARRWNAQGRLKQAHTLMSECVELTRKKFGPDHPYTKQRTKELKSYTKKLDLMSSSSRPDDDKDVCATNALSKKRNTQKTQIAQRTDGELESQGVKRTPRTWASRIAVRLKAKLDRGRDASDGNG